MKETRFLNLRIYISKTVVVFYRLSFKFTLHGLALSLLIPSKAQGFFGFRDIQLWFLLAYS